MKLVLIGMMGSGKSSVGRRVANELNWDFYDIDSEIEIEEKRKISELFLLYGEERFRFQEKKVIQRLSNKDKIVLSTGGGAPCNEENWKSLSRNGFIVWLKASAQKLLERVQKKPLEARPLLNSKDTPLNRIIDLLKVRESVYRKADFILDTECLTVPEVSEKIVEWIKTKYE